MNVSRAALGRSTNPLYKSRCEVLADKDEEFTDKPRQFNAIYERLWEVSEDTSLADITHHPCLSQFDVMM